VHQDKKTFNKQIIIFLGVLFSLKTPKKHSLVHKETSIRMFHKAIYNNNKNGNNLNVLSIGRRIAKCGMLI
jgi:hypothetical protein